MTNIDTECHFQLIVDSQPVNVHYRPEYFRCAAHLEFTSPIEGRRNPTSETGYRSYFFNRQLAAAAPDIETFALAVAHALASGRSSPQEDMEDDAGQLALF